MNKEQQILNLLGMARRANQLISGEGMVIDAIRKQKVALVLIASDSGKNTKKKIHDKSHYYQIPCHLFSTMPELSHAIGQKRTVVGIVGQGFANKIQQLLEK